MVDQYWWSSITINLITSDGNRAWSIVIEKSLTMCKYGWCRLIWNHHCIGLTKYWNGTKIGWTIRLKKRPQFIWLVPTLRFAAFFFRPGPMSFQIWWWGPEARPRGRCFPAGDMMIGWLEDGIYEPLESLEYIYQCWKPQMIIYSASITKTDCFEVGPTWLFSNNSKATMDSEARLKSSAFNASQVHTARAARQVLWDVPWCAGDKDCPLVGHGSTAIPWS